jgi:hypothetical protein
MDGVMRGERSSCTKILFAAFGRMGADGAGRC